MILFTFSMESQSRPDQIFWGGEFVDDGSYGKLFLKETVVDGIYLPIHIIEKTLDAKYIAEIYIKDIDYINELKSSISIVGILEPGTLTYDLTSVRLSDGNHRFLAAKHLGLDKFPVQLKRVDNLKSRSIKFEKLFIDLLELICQEK